MTLCTNVSVANIEKEMYLDRFEDYGCCGSCLPGKNLCHFIRHNMMKGQLSTYEADKINAPIVRGSMADIASAALGLGIVYTLYVNFGIAASLYE